MVVGYLRVSTEKQHLSNQQDEILRFAQTRNMEIDRWVTEVVKIKRTASWEVFCGVWKTAIRWSLPKFRGWAERLRKLWRSWDIVWIKGLPFIRPRTVMPLTIRSTVKSCASLSVSWRRSNGTWSRCVRRRRLPYARPKACSSAEGKVFARSSGFCPRIAPKSSRCCVTARRSCRFAGNTRYRSIRSKLFGNAMRK